MPAGAAIQKKMTTKEINLAAKDHAKAILGEGQFKNNKDAAEAIAQDFKAGVEWYKTQIPVSIEELELLKEKAEKWDKLGEKIDKCYGDYNENNVEMKSEYEEENGSEPDLGTIGEIAASAYGYL